MKKLISLLLVSMLILSGCNTETSKEGTSNQSSSQGSKDDSFSSSSDAVDVTFAKDDSEMFTDRDYEVGYDRETSVSILLNGDAISCDSNAVKIDGTTVTLLKEETYIISGILNDGAIVVEAGKKDKIQIVLDDVTIHSKTSAPISIVEGDKVFITLAEGTTNTLTNEQFDSSNEEDAVIYSKQDLTLNGSGSLVIESPSGHGIVSKDDLVITSGTYTITSASKGLDANDSVRIANAKVTIESGKDGIHAEHKEDASLGFIYIASGVFQIAAEGDGMSASAHIQIEGGTFDIISGGGSENASHSTSESWGMMGGRPDFNFNQKPQNNNQGYKPNSGEDYKKEDYKSEDRSSISDSNATEDSTSIKGVKASLDILISNGTFTIDSADDAIHSNTNITVNDGTFEIASGDDAFHADDTLKIKDGVIHISESYEGLEALHVEVTGGDITLVASDDGMNAAGGKDSSGMGGFGGMHGGDKFGGMGSGSSDGTITISGGNIYMNASGDGIDANGMFEMSGGYVVVCGPTQGDTAVLDYDVSATITGGTFIGTGSSMMAQTFSNSTQGVLGLSVGSQSAGTKIVLKDKNGKELISCEPKLAYQIVILSSPDMVSGEQYTITVGTSEGTFEAS